MPRFLRTVRRMTIDLKVSTPVLHDAGRSLLFVHRELDAAKERADVETDVIADERLRDRLHHFATDWDRKRLKTMEHIASLGQLAEQGACAFEQVEASLTRALGGRG